jgi:hypothetical protein
MERDLWTREDLRNLIRSLSQTTAAVPDDSYRLGYLSALRDMATACGVPPPYIARQSAGLTIEVQRAD